MQRLDRLRLVIGKMQEVREQRHALLAQLKEKMDQEDKDAASAGLDDSDVLGDLKGSKVDIEAVAKKKLNQRYGSLVRISLI